MRYVPGPLALCAILSLFLPVAVAEGQSDPLDPDSPAGVEYQLPLDRARKNVAVRDPGSGADRPGAVPLFGAGIVAAKTGDQAGGGGQQGGSDGGGLGRDASGGTAGSRSDDDGRRGREGPAGAPPALSDAAVPSPDEDGGSAALRIGGIAAAVLLLGALLGLFLRRGLRQAEN